MAEVRKERGEERERELHGAWMTCYAPPQSTLQTHPSAINGGGTPTLQANYNEFVAGVALISELQSDLTVRSSVGWWAPHVARGVELHRAPRTKYHTAREVLQASKQVSCEGGLRFWSARRTLTTLGWRRAQCSHVVVRNGQRFLGRAAMEVNANLRIAQLNRKKAKLLEVRRFPRAPQKERVREEPSCGGVLAVLAARAERSEGSRPTLTRPHAA
jgi:hypothetical protein